jgi:transcriptional regulator with XRE-family HTH domain
MLLKTRRLRLERGMSLKSAARLVGVPAPTLSGVETGRVVPWPGLRTKLADLYRVPEAELFVDIDAAQAFLRQTAGERPT